MQKNIFNVNIKIALRIKKLKAFVILFIITNTYYNKEQN